MTVTEVPEWPKKVGVDPFYRVPIYRQRSSTFLRFSGIQRNGRHQFMVPGLGMLDWYVGLRKSDTLRVVLHGAVNREKDRLPRFDRVRTSLQSEDAYIAFADPILPHSDSVGIGWYLGNSQVDPTKHILNVIRKVKSQVGAKKVLFIGGSAGGFAALRLSAAMPGSGVFALSPQTRVSKYHGRLVRQLLDGPFDPPKITMSNFQHTFSGREDLSVIYGETETDNRIYHFQNLNDPFHLREHFEPFKATMEHLELQGIRKVGSYKSVIVDSVKGHGPPRPDEFEDHLLLAKQHIWS